MTRYRVIILRVLLFAFILRLSSTLQAQIFDNKVPYYIEVAARKGQNVPFFVTRHAYIKDYPQYGIDCRLGYPTSGKQEWEQWFNYPTYGLLLRYEHNTLDSARYLYRDANNNVITDWVSIGNSYTMGMFFNGHLYKTKLLSFDYDIAGGISLWSKFGNEFIGSLLTIHLSIDAGPTVHITPNMDLIARAMFSHSSNGALFLPNNGINVISYQLGMRYHCINRVQTIRTDSLSWHKKTTVFISNAVGLTQTNTLINNRIPCESPYFFANSMRIGIVRQCHPKFLYDIALDFNFTGETKIRYELAQQRYEHGIIQTSLQTYNPWKATHFAVSALFEIKYNRISFCLGGAYYLYHGIYTDTDEKKTWTIIEDKMSDFERQYLPYTYKNLYERLGLKYYFGHNRNQFVGAFMKVHMDSIDYIEWTYGIYLKQWTSTKTNYRKR